MVGSHCMTTTSAEKLEVCSVEAWRAKRKRGPRSRQGWRLRIVGKPTYYPLRPILNPAWISAVLWRENVPKQFVLRLLDRYGSPSQTGTSPSPPSCAG